MTSEAPPERSSLHEAPSERLSLHEAPSERSSTCGSTLRDWLDAHGRGVWLRVERVRGSAPREAGAWMLVGEHAAAGTIGGGHFEFQAIDEARRMLRGGPRVSRRTVTLGPSLGQCCGGAVELSYRIIDATERGWIEQLAALEHDRPAGTVRLSTGPGTGRGPHSRLEAALDEGAGVHARDGATGEAPATAGDGAPAARTEATGFVSVLCWDSWQVWVFGAGHVGAALVQVLATLPFSVVWVDPRGGQFPSVLPAGVRRLDADSPAHEVAAIPSGADVIVMTHSHALDFEICCALLARDDLGLCGLIGSSSKAARFARRLAHRGIEAARIARLHCPIGRRDPDAGRTDLDKHPGAIALSIVDVLWQCRRHAAAPRGIVPGAPRLR